jgi:aspartate/methionine/tyrosine aminotransferase
MKIDVFAMERMQSTYENQVELNLSESGVYPLRLADLADDEAARAALLDRELRYTQSNGTIPLRSSIASLYHNATPECVQVTNGGSEANYITTWNLGASHADLARPSKSGRSSKGAHPLVGPSTPIH